MSTSEGATRVLVVGVGGIGGSLAGVLNEDPRGMLDVEAVSTNPEVCRSVQDRGFALRGLHGERDVPGRISGSLSADTRPFDFIFLATRPPQVEAAARSTLPFLKDTGAMVCFQNGLCEDRIARIAGADRVLGAIVAWGASMPEPGQFERTSSGGFVLGRMDQAADLRLDELGLLLEPIGPVTQTGNLPGARWSKLALNCAVSSLGTLGRARLGSLLKHRVVRRLALEIMTEVVQVAQAEGVALEKVSGTMDLDWLALTESEKAGRAGPALVAKHSLLLAVGTRYRRLRSSMLRAIERGRTPAVDFLNGEIVQRGSRLEIPTPFNARTTELVHAMARGEVEGGIPLIMELAQGVET